MTHTGEINMLQRQNMERALRKGKTLQEVTRLTKSRKAFLNLLLQTEFWKDLRKLEEAGLCVKE